MMVRRFVIKLREIQKMEINHLVDNSPEKGIHLSWRLKEIGCFLNAWKKQDQNLLQALDLLYLHL